MIPQKCIDRNCPRKGIDGKGTDVCILYQVNEKKELAVLDVFNVSEKQCKQLRASAERDNEKASGAEIWRGEGDGSKAPSREKGARNEKSGDEALRLVASADAASQERRSQMSIPTKNPFLPEDKQPLMECWTCGHYRSREEDGFQDWVRGRCDHTGSSVVPPRHVCEAWCKRTKKKGGEE